MEQSPISYYLGQSAWILLLIPLVLLVRLVSRRSRWSILRMILVTVTGVLAAALWLRYAELAAGAAEGAFGGRLGLVLAGKLESWTCGWSSARSGVQPRTCSGGSEWGTPRPDG